MRGEPSLLRRSVEPYRDNVELKGFAEVSEASGSKHGIDHDLPVYDYVDSTDEDGAWGDTAHDRRDMLRMGKKQEFVRNFSFLSALGFVSVYMASWEFVLVSLSVGFSNGGYAGLFW